MSYWRLKYIIFPNDSGHANETSSNYRWAEITQIGERSRNPHEVERENAAGGVLEAWIWIMPSAWRRCRVVMRRFSLFATVLAGFASFRKGIGVSATPRMSFTTLVTMDPARGHRHAGPLLDISFKVRKRNNVSKMSDSVGKGPMKETRQACDLRALCFSIFETTDVEHTCETGRR